MASGRTSNPGWIPSSGQCNSLKRLLISLMFDIRMLCPILSNGRRRVRENHFLIHLALNAINSLTESIYFVYSIIWYHWNNQKVRNEIVDDFDKSGQKVVILYYQPYLFCSSLLLCHSSYLDIEEDNSFVILFLIVFSFHSSSLVGFVTSKWIR